MGSEPTTTQQDHRDLGCIGSGPDDSVYYADNPGADWGRLKELERRGLAATADQSHWWCTDAGRLAIAQAQRAAPTEGEDRE